MSKSYLFDGRSLGALLLSGTVAGLLLFFAGILVGYHWSSTELAAAPTPPQTAALPEAEDPEPGKPQVLARRRIPSPPPGPLASPLAEPVTPPPLVSKVRSKAAALLPEFTPEEAPAEVAAQPSPPPSEERPDLALPPLPPPPPAFSLQVGAFLETENLERFVADLTERGYTPRVQEVTSSNGRVLSIVRLGGFEERSAATQAALTFQKREGMDAFVRPEARS